MEAQVWEEFRPFQGKVCVESKEEALRTATEWQDKEGTIWTDGSRLEDGRVGAAYAFWDGERAMWRTAGFLLGDNKEVFDAEVFAILRTVRSFNERQQTDQHYTVFSDS